MSELVWFASGAAAAGLVALAVRLRRLSTRPPSTATLGKVSTASAAHVRIVGPIGAAPKGPESAAEKVGVGDACVELKVAPPERSEPATAREAEEVASNESVEPTPEVSTEPAEETLDEILEETLAEDHPPPFDARRVVSSIADEVANLASAIEGSAFDLVDAAPEPNLLPPAAQSFLASVQRLRTLHGKLLAFGSDVTTSTGTADLGEVVSSLVEDLQHMRLGLELEAQLMPGLPPTDAGPETVRNVILFACSAMFRAEPGATHLTIAAERCLAKEEPRLRIELLLEWVADRHSPSGPTMRDSNVTFAIEAATRLCVSHGGEVAMSRLPSRAVRTLVLLPSARGTAPCQDSDAESLPEPATTVRRHEFGGALVVESDPDVRAMLAKELRARGRSVFACSDGTSARTFLEATPDRFELLIVDKDHRLDDGDALGETIRRLTPELKICVLSGPDVTGASEWPGLRRIEKPFGVHELRQALATVLDGR